METAKSSITFVEFFSDKDFSVPIWEIAILLFILSAFIVSGKHKYGLLTAYLFLFYWGFILNRGYILELMSGVTWGVYLYSTLGVLAVILAIIGFFIKTDD
jgi:hypothetical protein